MTIFAVFWLHKCILGMQKWPKSYQPQTFERSVNNNDVRAL